MQLSGFGAFVDVAGPPRFDQFAHGSMVGAIRAGDVQGVNHHHPGVSAGGGQAVDHGQQSDTVGRGQRSPFNEGILHVDIDERGFRGDQLIFGHVVNLRCKGYLRHSHNGHKGHLVFRVIAPSLVSISTKVRTRDLYNRSPAAAPNVPLRPTFPVSIAFPLAVIGVGPRTDGVPKISVFRTRIFGETKHRRCWVSGPSFSKGFRNRVRQDVAGAQLRAGENSFATANAPSSLVSNAIFCASMTSPATKQMLGTKHQPTRTEPSFSISWTFIEVP